MTEFTPLNFLSPSFLIFVGAALTLCGWTGLLICKRQKSIYIPADLSEETKEMLRSFYRFAGLVLMIPGIIATLVGGLWLLLRDVFS